MKNFKLTIFILIASITLFSSCSVTNPSLSYSGNSYNSISDDIIMQESKNEAVNKLVSNLNANDKILLVQVKDDANCTVVADQIFEKMYENNFFVKQIKQSDLANFDSDQFNKTLMFYPSIMGTESAQTLPSNWTKLAGLIPVLGKKQIEKHTYLDRLAAISLHCRLIDNNSGEIEWIKNFTGQAKVRIHSGKMYDIVFPE